MGSALYRLPSRKVTSGAKPRLARCGLRQVPPAESRGDLRRKPGWRGVGNAQDRLPIRDRAWSVPVNSYSSVCARLQPSKALRAAALSCILESAIKQPALPVCLWSFWFVQGRTTHLKGCLAVSQRRAGCMIRVGANLKAHPTANRSMNNSGSY